MTRLKTTDAYRRAMVRHTGQPVSRRTTARYEAALLRAARQEGRLPSWPDWQAWRRRPMGRSR